MYKVYISLDLNRTNLSFILVVLFLQKKKKIKTFKSHDKKYNLYFRQIENKKFFCHLRLFIINKKYKITCKRYFLK